MFNQLKADFLVELRETPDCLHEVVAVCKHYETAGLDQQSLEDGLRSCSYGRVQIAEIMREVEQML